MILDKTDYLTNLKESDLFDLLKKVIPDLQRTDQFNTVDAFSLNRQKLYEFKCRRTDYVNLIIEKIKFDSLKTKGKVYYINSTPRGIYSFNIAKINEPTWMIKLMPETTDFDRNNKIDKVVGYLNIYQDGQEITDLLIKK